MTNHDDNDDDINTMTMTTFHYMMPSETQQYVISWLQIGPSIFSLVGSYLIIYNIRRNYTREKSKLSPYRRIMFSLSLCNMISAIGWILDPFLVPSTVSDQSSAWVYAVGNEASCVMLGAISQFSITTQHLFLAFLSLYFLMTVKFGIPQRDFEVNYEPWMHGCIYLFASITAITGIALGYFRPNVISPGCWINPPNGDEDYCGGGDGGDDYCPEHIFAFAVGAVPFMLSLLTMIVSNVMLYFHVRTTVVKAQKKCERNELKLADFVETNTNKQQNSTPSAHYQPVDESISHTGSVSETNHGEDELLEEGAQQHQEQQDNVGDTIYPKRGGSTIYKNETSVLSDAKGTVLSSVGKQWKRVRQVGRQAFLYVGAYLVTFSWTFAVHYLKAQNSKNNNAGDILFPLVVLQAIGGGSLGWIMGLIYFVPKIKQTRIKYEYEPWWWIVEQAITGDAERVERFSSISNVSSIKGDRSVSSSPYLSPNPNKRKVEGGKQPKKKLSWKGDLSPMMNVPNAINVDTSEQFKNNKDNMENSLPRLPLGDMMIEEGEEEEELVDVIVDDDPDTTDTDLEQSGCFIVVEDCAAPIASEPDPTTTIIINDTDDLLEPSGCFLAIDAAGGLKTSQRKT